MVANGVVRGLYTGSLFEKKYLSGRWSYANYYSFKYAGIEKYYYCKLKLGQYNVILGSIKTLNFIPCILNVGKWGVVVTCKIKMVSSAFIKFST